MSPQQHSYPDRVLQEANEASMEWVLVRRLIREYTKAMQALNEHTAQVQQILSAMDDQEQRQTNA